MQQEREYYEYVFVKGKIVHKLTGDWLETRKKTSEVTKWIFVMSTCKKLYSGEVRSHGELNSKVLLFIDYFLLVAPFTNTDTFQDQCRKRKETFITLVS